ncbi:UNVERIFIED_CONTAM: hypothetical protein K2H54_017453 [Gekko kuhli]
MRNGTLLGAEEGKYLFHAGGLVIFSLTAADAGLYECQSVEKAPSKEFRVTTAAYRLSLPSERGFLVPQRDSSHGMRGSSEVTGGNWSVALPETEEPGRQEQPRESQGLSFILAFLGSFFAFLFLSLLAWNVHRGHLSLPWKGRARRPPAANTDGLASPSLGRGQVYSAQKSLPAQPVPSTIGESAPLVSSSGEQVIQQVKVKCSTGRTMGPIIFSTPSFVIATFPQEDYTVPRTGKRRQSGTPVGGGAVASCTVVAQQQREAGLRATWPWFTFRTGEGSGTHLAHYNKHSTITSREIQMAVHLLLSGQLVKHAVSEGTKAVTKYMSPK